METSLFTAMSMVKSNIVVRRISFWAITMLLTISMIVVIKRKVLEVDLCRVTIPEVRVTVCLFSRTNLPDSLTWSLNLKVEKEELLGSQRGLVWSTELQINSSIDFPTDYRLTQAFQSHDIIHICLSRNGHFKFYRFRLILEKPNLSNPHKPVLEQLDVVQ